MNRIIHLAESEGGVLRHPVVLMHNQPAGNPATVRALPVIIRFFRSRGLPAEVIYLSGSVELAPNLGLAETIMDLVETGRTLRENGLVVLEEVVESTARVVVNRASFHIQQAEVQEFLRSLRKVLE